MDNNRSNQLNPNNTSFWRSRGYDDRPSGWLEAFMALASLAYSLTQSDRDNRSNQLNPNSSVFHSSRGQTKP